MTLIVGVLCTDGVVIGTDSAVTFATAGREHTIEQYARQKIHVIENHIIVAGTGQVGLGQRFADVAEHHWKKEDFQEKSVLDIGRMLATSALNDFSQTSLMQIPYGALAAVPCRDKAELIEFQYGDFQPEVKTKDIWYASMGSGQPVADPLLGFMRKTFWGDSPPTRQDGVFAVTMVLELGCEMAPTGVAAPIQIAVLAPNPDDKGRFSASRLTEEELLEHRDNVNNAIKHFSEYKKILHSAPKEPPSPPP